MLTEESGLLTVIVPVHNEAANLGRFLEALMAVLEREQYEYEIIFVDDGSTDRSAEILTAFAGKNPQCRVIQFRRNFGQTAAMMAGLDYASGEVIVPIDADLQNDPEDIPRLLEKTR